MCTIAWKRLVHFESQFRDRTNRLFHEKSPIIIVFLKDPRRREKLQWNYTDTFPFVITDRAWRTRNLRDGKEDGMHRAEWSLVCTSLISRASASFPRRCRISTPLGIHSEFCWVHEILIVPSSVRIRDAISSNRSTQDSAFDMRESVMSWRRGPNHR